jgi:hypothetical protein
LASLFLLPITLLLLLHFLALQGLEAELGVEVADDISFEVSVATINLILWYVVNCPADACRFSRALRWRIISAWKLQTAGRKRRLVNLLLWAVINSPAGLRS